MKNVILENTKEQYKLFPFPYREFYKAWSDKKEHIVYFSFDFIGRLIVTPIGNSFNVDEYFKKYIDPETMCRYTGVNGVGGIPLYEHDIVSYQGYNGAKSEGEIIYSDGCFNVGKHQGSSTKKTPILINSRMRFIRNKYDKNEGND